MEITAREALLFLPFVTPLCIWVAASDLRAMKIRNKAVLALGAVFVLLGLFVLPWDQYLWRLSQLVIVLIVGIALNAAGAIGAGDAKFAAAAAPFIALGDLRTLMVLYAANLLAAFITHRLAKHSALRRLAPSWESWHRQNAFPMGFSLGPTLVLYLALGAYYGR